METTTEKEKKISKDQRNIDAMNDLPGWGYDADPKNDPTYPMKHHTDADHQRLNYNRPPQQPATLEVLHSNERPSLSRVFGTAPPPSGLSGMMRRYAFGFSEGNALHWLTLMLADRVNVVEGVIDDLAHGHVPNFFKERGLVAEWKYNRPKALRKLAIGVAVTSAVVALAIYRSRNKKLLKA